VRDSEHGDVFFGVGPYSRQPQAGAEVPAMLMSSMLRYIFDDTCCLVPGTWYIYLAIIYFLTLVVK
jgi:hypothetical protein